MEKYVKPVVLVNEDLAEGVYASSGSASTGACWDISVVSTQEWTGWYHEFEVKITHRLNQEHISKAATAKIEFSSLVTEVNTECSRYSIEGTTVSVTRESHANSYKNGDVATFKVRVRSIDEETTRSISAVKWDVVNCDGSINVQGNGADEL